MGYYLLLRAISTPLLLLLLHESLQPTTRAYQVLLGKIYFFTFFGAYLAAVVLLFFTCIEVFRSALAPFPGIARFAIVVFRWAATVSVVVSLASAIHAPMGLNLFADISFDLMRSASILSLCLLAFLCISMNALRLSPRDPAFGIAFGFGVMASGDLIAASLSSHLASLNDPIQFVYEGLILLSLAVWGAYSLLPEPTPKPILVPASSTIYRWNEIASALGHGTRVAVQQPANGFFLSDVERVVEKVLAKNMKDSESET